MFEGDVSVDHLKDYRSVRSPKSFFVRTCYVSCNGGIAIQLKHVLILIALAMLCMPTFGQTIVDEWYSRGVALYEQGNYDEAIKAFVIPSIYIIWI